MNMTNREESNAAEHETYPGPGPLKADEAKRNMRPVEQMVDAAIERIARETQARAARSGSSSNWKESSRKESSHALTLAREDAAALMAMDSAADSQGGQLARSERRGKGRLRWKGLEVSEEFRDYADRVARGEDLPPFTGKILAEPDPAFPWDPSVQKHAARRAVTQQVGLWTGVALFLGLSIAVLVAQIRGQADAWQAAESPLASVTMANQPSAAGSAELPEAKGADSLAGSLSGGVAAGAAENAPVAFQETVLEPAGAGSSSVVTSGGATPSPATPAKAALTPPAVAASSAASVGPAAPPGSATLRPVSTAKVAAPAPSSAGPLIARAPAAEATPGAAGATAAMTAPGEAGWKAVGTAGTAAAASLTAGVDGASADPASALRADPKKEPTDEASGMGSLLVESPSF